MPGQAAEHVRNVLVLSSTQPELPASQALVIGLESVLRTDPSVRVYYEFLDAMRFPGEAYRQQDEQHLRAKFARTHFHAAIAIGPEALSFLIDREPYLVSPSNVVFGGISEERVLTNSSISGVVSYFDIVKTLELMERLQPSLKHVVVVTGASPFDKQWEMTARAKFYGFSSKYRFSYLAGLPMAELLNRIATLPEDTAVLYLTVFEDGEGVRYLPRDVADKIFGVTKAPVYSVYDTLIGRGIVGGHMDTFEAVGRQVGDMTLKKLAGATQPTIELSRSHNFIVDWRALERWGLPESALPPGVEVRFKPVSPWVQYREVILGAAAVFLGLCYLVLRFYREVRERRRAEQTATDNRDKIELSVSAANLGLWEWDPITDKVWTSEHCRELLGLGNDAIIPREQFLNCLQDEDRTLAVARMLKAMTTGTQCEAEYGLPQKDGTIKWLASRASPRKQSGGRAGRLLGVLMDITERKLAEHEAIEQRKQLTHLTRVSVLGALSGALAHELNQPLTAILSNAQAARRILARKPYDIAEIRQILEDIVDDDKRAGDVIHHLRTLLRREEGPRTPIDINQLVTSVLDLARSDLVLKGVTVTRELCRDCTLIDGDAVQLQQVLLNLIVNACDAMSHKLPAERRLGIVTKMTKKGKLRISVIDNGEGISENSLKSLFEPFHTTKALGLGLGLPICNWIIQAHGGKIFAHSNPEGGATFSFDLPLPVKVTDEPAASHSLSG
ncbi:sensor histidine kinase [Taklimakanibacter deserti]|uniref:sensor histidine kinase n=1 Tax=Taklimakanibacter deserti TaxID=2267839 RepID=UPI000E6557E2